jgi:hypothetical protein
MRKRQGVVIIDTIKRHDQEIPIRLDKESGEFQVEVGGHSFCGKDLGQVRQQAIDLLDETNVISFEPVIVVAYVESNTGHGPDEESIEFQYERYYRGKMKSGKEFWKTFVAKNEIDDEDHVEGQRWKDVVGGRPGEATSVPWILRETANDVMEYTPERWTALRQVSRAVAEINRRLHQIVKEGRTEDFLANISRHGTAGLLLMSPEKAKDVSVIRRRNG